MTAAILSRIGVLSSARSSQRVKQHGFQVLRFWDHQVFQDLDAVLQAIADALEIAPLPASPTPHD